MHTSETRPTRDARDGKIPKNTLDKDISSKMRYPYNGVKISHAAESYFPRPVH
jgi:hypothetical protein